MNQKGNTLIIALVLGGLLVAGAAMYVFTKQGGTDVGTSPTVGEIAPEDLIDDDGRMKDFRPTVETTDREGVDEMTLVTPLVDVSGGNSTGTGYITRKDGLAHSVTAKLPEPTGNNFYEGWLVQQLPTVSFFSTGEMVLDNQGNYVLEYESDNEYEGYDFVVITLETIKDDTPEKHILEGTVE